MGRPRTRTVRFAIALTGVALLAGIVVATASALAFEQGDPCNDTKPLFVCPGGTVGASYSITYKASGGCGPALPYQYRVMNGALPPGLSLSSSGTVSGRPTQSGTWNFWVELSDEDPPSLSWCAPKKADREFRITIEPGISINQQTAKPGTTGQAYSEQLTATMVTNTNTNPVTGSPATTAAWSVASGTLPTGVTLNATGLLSGTPTTEGSYQFVVRAQLDASRFDTETLAMVVRAPVVAVAPPTAPFGGTTAESEVGVPVSTQLTATGGTGGPYTWTLTSGSLPASVALAADGTISGTPRAAGRFAFTASATDTEGRVGNYVNTLNVAAKLDIVTQRIRPGKVGKLYRAKLVTLGGVKPTVWKVKKGPLPRGIRLDRKLGILSGTPRKGGTYRVWFEVVDKLGVKSTQLLTLLVIAPKT